MIPLPAKPSRSTKTPKKAPARAKKAPESATREPPTEPRNVNLGDILKIERRYIVEGVLTCVTDKGKFAGVQTFGSAEHLVIEDKKTGEARMIPLHTISEITLIEAVKQGTGLGLEPAFDPSIA